MQIELEAPSFTTAHTPDGWKVTIPMQKHWAKSLITLVWLCGWLFGEIVVGKQLLGPAGKSSALFLTAWLILWTTGGIIALIDLLWHLSGREHVVVSGNQLHHHVELICGIRTTRSYDTASIQHLRTIESGRPRLKNNFSFFQSVRGSLGTIAFDYGARTYHFGAFLDAATARILIEQLQARLPQQFSPF